MPAYDEAFIFLAPGSNEVEEVALEHAGTRTGLIWAPDAERAARAAAEVAAGGARLIELYRGFDLGSAGQVIDAVVGRTPVGAAISSASDPEPARHTATIYADEEANPAVDRVVHRSSGGATTTVVGASDADFVTVATELVDAGTELVEICGGTPLTTAARVAAAVGDRARVTHVSWPFESLDGVSAYKAAFEAAHPSDAD